jgi:hypothetical protein
MRGLSQAKALWPKYQLGKASLIVGQTHLQYHKGGMPVAV